MPIKCLPNLLNEQVSTTGLTHEWILSTLSQHDHTFEQSLNGGEVTSITAVDISVGQGYAAKIYKTRIFVNDQKDPVYKCVLKIPNADCFNDLMDKMFDEAQKAKMPFMEKMLVKLTQFHNIECDFYELFKEDINGLPMPKLTYTQKFYPQEKQLGLIIMEDLSETGQTLGIYGTLHIFQIKIIVKYLAAFHAHLLTNEQVDKNRFENIPFIDEEFKDMIKPTLDSICKFRSGMFENHFKRMENLFSDMKVPEYIFRGCCEDLGLPTLIQLGDMWTNNILWETKPDGSTPNKVLAFIDFQLAFKGNPAFDMARLITFCTDAEVRRELETFIFDFYYENLTKFLEPAGKKPEFDVGKFKTAYEYAMVNQAFQLTFSLLAFGKTVRKDEVERKIHEAKVEKLVLRAKLGIDDAIKVLERIQPDWLVDGVSTELVI